MFLLTSDHIRVQRRLKHVSRTYKETQELPVLSQRRSSRRRRWSYNPAVEFDIQRITSVTNQDALWP